MNFIMVKAFINARSFAAAAFGTSVFIAFVALSYAKLDRQDLQTYAGIYVIYLGLIAGLSALTRRPASNQNSALLIATFAFFAGPTLAFLFWAAGVFFFSSDYYLTWAERTENLPHMLTLGLFVGAIAAVGLAIFKSK
jgi:hypothetical protein